MHVTVMYSERNNMVQNIGKDQRGLPGGLVTGLGGLPIGLGGLPLGV
jgi:hypothetical protein